MLGLFCICLKSFPHMFEVLCSLQTIVELELLLQEKLDLGTLGVLSKATALASHDTGNLEFCSGNSAITLCVWGNLSKNPRSVT